MIASVATVGTCDASPNFGGRHRTSSNDIAAPVLSFRRRIQSWVIRSGSQSKISATMRQRIKHSATSNDKNRSKKRGSFFTSQHPTKERLFRWFGMEGEDPNQFMRCMILRNQFNHDICGITNPFLKILPSSKLQQEQRDYDIADGSTVSKLDGNRRRSFRPLLQVDGGIFDGSRGPSEKIVLTARSNDVCPSIKLGSSKNIENSWWPSLQISQSQKQDSLIRKWRIFQRKNKMNHGSDAQNSNFRKQDWRILTYRKRVGRGKACYESVRDTALDWEFESADGSTGMLQVPDSDPSDSFGLNRFPGVSSNAKRYYSVSSSGDNESDSNRDPNAYSPSSSLYRKFGSRRLVSFASKSVAEFLPSFLRRRIYSINPVMVVYDVVDQRAPDGQTTFTSTAYATLKGHFLRGEERVTVALRDGSQDVEVEILSISRAGPGIAGKTLWPFIGKMQSNFFQQQLHHLSQSGLIIDASKISGSNHIKIEKFTEGNDPLQ